MSTNISLAGMSLTAEYVIDEHVNYIFEIDTARVRNYLPTYLCSKEPRHGVSLINIGYMKFDATQIGGLAETIELTLSIVVDPDLSLEMAVPRISVYDITIASNCPTFLAHEDRLQRLNGIYLPGLSRSLRGPGDLEVWDEDGTILEFRNPSPNPIYKYEYVTGQYVSAHPSGLYHGVFSWEGVGCEQQVEGDCGGSLPHRFYHDLDVGSFGNCYMQMFLPDAGQALFSSFYPRRLR
ncbi:hypothetical protein B0G75_12477 [Paraburkholderia sp. BL18I3N2]|uniref:hypothetical protein n=1 Tax=unclassified Paraburkholderia TaxID=2615204 RepID=UPI000D04AB14|nr:MULTISPECIES: hypothetical protein [unclassified Paraburkholderia]PRX24034.1 hypothetical protein B0G75_12477 [Paraburkholderia sp. BL18I3N2]PRX87518.1 hypothetical protein B0G73_15210 [Paraburkholderia sp. BL25I1N1]